MKCNINNLIEFIKKATVRDMIDFVQINVSENQISSSLISERKDVVSVLSKDNNIFSQYGKNEKTEFVLNWKEPSQNLIPYLKIFSEDELVDCQIKDQDIILKQGKIKTKINQSIEDVKQILKKKWDLQKFNFFYEFELTDEFKEDFSVIKRLAASFEKIYFTVENNKLFLETFDSSNTFSNKLSIAQKDVNSEDLFLCFDFRAFLCLMDVLKTEEKKYTFKMNYDKNYKAGMLFVFSDDNDEIYTLTSKREL